MTHSPSPASRRLASKLSQAGKTLRLLAFAFSVHIASVAAAQDATPAPAANQAASQTVAQPGVRSLVGFASYPKRGIRLAHSEGPLNGLNGERTRDDTPFRIASITKTFTAAAIFKLIEQGKFELDSPIQPLLSPAIEAQLRLAEVDPRTISVRQLLAHRSGFQDYVGEAYAAQLVANPARKWTRSEQLAGALQLGVSPPDAAYLYADTNYILLGEIIEQSTQSTLAASYRSLLNFAGLGLKSTYLESVEAPPAGVGEKLHAYVRGFDTSQIDASFDLYGGGGLVSTAKDVTLFFRALFAGRVISKASVALMSESVSGGGFSEAAYGLGVMPFYIGNFACYGHIGFSNVIAGHCPSIDYTFVYAGGSDLITELRLTEQGLGYLVARAILIDTTPKPLGADFERTRCRPELLSEGANVTCGVLAVEQVRGQRGTKLVRVPVVIAKHRSRPAHLQPLLLLGGGPGDALFPILPSLLGDAEASAALLDGQDVIAAEYRGTGAAKPNLQCDARITNPTTVALCLEKMRGLGVDLQRYNGAEFAKDIEQLRRSLRVSKWNLAGFSYGTRQALTILRENPATVRSMVLDGVTAPGESFSTPRSTARSLDAIFQSCQNDLSCNAAFPGLKARFVARMQQLNQMPMQLNLSLITGDALVQSLTLFQGQPELLAYIPAVMDRYASADVDFIAPLLGAPPTGEFLPPDPAFSDALFFSTVCNESAPFVNFAQYNSDASDQDPILRAYARQALDTLNVCRSWPSGRANEIENRAVAVTVPTLVLNGVFDLQTPAENGRALAASNPRQATSFEFPVGHVALVQAPACATQLLIGFQRSRDGRGFDSSCVSAQPAVVWRTEIDAGFFALIGIEG